MESIMSLIQLLLHILLTALFAAMTVVQWLAAGEFRWYVGGLLFITVLGLFLIKESVREYQDTKR